METLTTMNFRGGRDPGCCLLILFSIIVVPALIITLHAHAEVCHADNKNLFCNGNTYQVGSVFERNLNIIFNRLVRDTYQTGFNISVYGESPHQIHGLLQCRGDATSDQCYNCSLNATTTVRQTQSCGKAMGARIWLDLCFLRYENFSFIGELDDYTGRYHIKQNNVSIDLIDFKAALQSLFASLSAKAANVPSSNLYASGTTADSFSPKTYALVQCTKDISAEDCTACLSNVTDNIFKCYYGRRGVQAFFSSCIVGYETYQFFNSAVVATRSPRPVEAPSNLPVATSPTSNKLPAILGVVGGGLFLALLVVCAFTTRRRLMRGDKVHKQVEEDTVVSDDGQIVTFKMETLVAATENFHDDNKLGKGGFGAVYKGTTHDGKEIAVKKLSLNSKQGKKEFLNEIKLITRIQHRNLVKLLGYCAERSERLLVYEYLRNGSLDKILFDPTKRERLDWRKRYNIILGVARGLLYLHEDSQLKIVHRDIKASNILLDEKLNPKIADFGLAKHFPEDETHISTNVAGTYGYMAPEYAMQGQGRLTANADVYSFGVLLMELITGRKHTDYNLSPEKQIMLGWAWRSYEEGKSVEIIDPVLLIESSDEEQALRCIHVGLLCTQADSSLRPPMSTVNRMLSNDTMTLPDPTKPSTGSSRSVSGLSPASIELTPLAPAPAPTSNAYANSITELAPR